MSSWRRLLSSALRTVAHNCVERVLVIHDDASSDMPRSWELNFHSVNHFTVNGSSASDVSGGAAGAFQTSPGFAVAPENGAARQFHAVLSTATNSGNLGAVTVIREDCLDLPVTVTTPAGLPATVQIGESVPLRLFRATATLGCTGAEGAVGHTGGGATLGHSKGIQHEV
jgi:hypothetical protein